MSAGGGDGGAGQRAADEEARKAKIRRHINALYGMAPSGARPPDVPSIGGKGISGKLLDKIGPAVQAEQAAYDADAAAASDASPALESEKTKLGDATRSYYTDQLGRDYTKAERATRFKLARQGLLGGSEDANQQGEVRSDRDLGATRVDESVRRAIAQLTGQREDERLNAINLVNAGAGDDAVLSAQAGLRNSLENVSSQQKADIFGDLFTGAADTGTAANLSNRDALYAQAVRNRLATFFPQTSTTSGRVTPSGG